MTPEHDSFRWAIAAGLLSIALSLASAQTPSPALLVLNKEGSLAIEVDGELAATTTLICYGRRLAWIGMVLTKLSYRGRGFARRLLTQALTQADEMRMETVKLDATDQGRTLYEKIGFRFEQAVERWTRPGSTGSSSNRPLGEAHPAEDWRGADQRAFGADRSKLLARLAQRGQPLLFLDGSYLLTRPGRQTRNLGPSVCETPTTARALMERVLQIAGVRDCSWDLLPRNSNATAIAHDLAFTPTRHLHRMVRGKDLRAKDEMIYAIAGFELG